MGEGKWTRLVRSRRQDLGMEYDEQWLIFKFYFCSTKGERGKKG